MMSFDLEKLYSKNNISLYIRAKKILDSNYDLDFDEVIAVQEDLEKYEAQIRELRHQIFRATHNDMIKMFIKSLDEDNGVDP
jgi:hypothetical protein